MAQWQGVFPAVTTKFTLSGELDHGEMERCFALQIAAGVDGLIVCGSLGEGQFLERSEKLEVLAIAKSVAKGRPVLMTVSDGATREASRTAEVSAKAGAGGLMILPGIPYKSDARETITHYRTVARSAGLPVMIYNNPVSYGVDITPEMLIELADEPLFAAVKESSDDARRITRIINLTGERYRNFTGVDNLALESILAGACGWVAGLVVAFPRETVELWHALRDHRLDDARALYRWFHPLLDLDVSARLVQNIKLAETIATGSNDRCRAPRLPLAGAERDRVAAIIHKALASRPALAGRRAAA